MSRLRKIAYDAPNFIENGVLLTNYLLENDIQYSIYYDMDDQKFLVYHLNLENAEQEFPIINDNKLKAFEDAERYIKQQQFSNEELKRKIMNKTPGLNINDSDVFSTNKNKENKPQDSEENDVLEQDDFVDSSDNDNSNNNDNSDNTIENNPDNIKDEDVIEQTIEIQFDENNIKTVREFINDAVQNDYINTYSLTPAAIKRFTLIKFSKVLKTISKLVNKSRLKRIVKAYSYKDLIDELSTNIVNDFNNFKVIAIYFSNETENEMDPSAIGFIIEYENQFITFGPNAENDILNLETILQNPDNIPSNGYKMADFIKEIPTMTNIKLENDFYVAEQDVLNMSNNSIKDRIMFSNAYEVQDDVWDNYIANNTVQETNVENEDNNTEENNTEENNTEENNTEEDNNSNRLMRLRIHFDNDKRNVKFLTDWVKKHRDIIKNLPTS